MDVVGGTSTSDAFEEEMEDDEEEEMILVSFIVFCDDWWMMIKSDIRLTSNYKIEELHSLIYIINVTWWIC